LLQIEKIDEDGLLQVPMLACLDLQNIISHVPSELGMSFLKPEFSIEISRFLKHLLMQIIVILITTGKPACRLAFAR